MVNEKKSKPSLAKKEVNRKHVFILLVLVLVGLVAADIGGVRSTAAGMLFHYAVEGGHASLAKLGLGLSSAVADERDQALRRAVAKNKPNQVRLLLELGGDPNIIIENDTPALYWCALKNFPEVAQWLSRAGANLNARPYKGWCALSVAINRHHNKVAYVLLDYGADIKAHPNYISKSPLWVAVRKGNLEILDWLLTMDVDTNVVIPSKIEGRSPTSVLDHALSKDQYEAAKILIRATGATRMKDEYVTANPFISNYCLGGIQRELDRRGYAGFKRTNVNPITHAVERNTASDKLLALIDQNTDAIDQPDDRGETPLLAAVERDRQVVVERLIKWGCNVNLADGSGITALWLAAEQQSVSILIMLLEAGADTGRFGCRDQNLYYLLMHRELMEPFKLLVAKKVNLNSADSLGTPLQIAFSYGRNAYIRLLLEAGADPFLKAGHLPAPVDYIQSDKRFAEFEPYIEKNALAQGSDLQWILKDAEPVGTESLHVISIYQGRGFKESQVSRVPVKVTDTSQPITLLLNSYGAVDWQIQVDPGVQLKKVYATGYYPQKVTGLDAAVPRAVSTKERKIYLKTHFINIKDQMLDLIEKSEKLTGLRPTTVQSEYKGQGFTVDGKKTIDFQRVVTKSPKAGAVVLVSAGGSGATVFGDGLSCRYGRAGASSTAKASRAYTAGKWYFEVTVNPGKKDNDPERWTNFGIFSADALYPDFHAPKGGEYGHNFAIPREFKRDVKGTDVIGVAVNLDDAKLYFSINGRWMNGEPRKTQTGLDIKPGRNYTAGLAVSASSNDVPDILTVNFGATPFKHAIPAEYRSYDGRQRGT